MNQDIFNACNAVYKQFRNDMVLFTENNLGEIGFGGEITKDVWESMCKHCPVKKLHLFELVEGNLEWLESFDSVKQSYDIPVNISDEDFLELAKKAHEKDITFNQLIVNTLQDYINNKRRIV